jgi:hypothetical protein
LNFTHIEAQKDKYYSAALLEKLATEDTEDTEKKSLLSLCPLFLLWLKSKVFASSLDAEGARAYTKIF